MGGDQRKGLSGSFLRKADSQDGNLPDERVRDVLETIFRHNFDSEQGLVNASCIEGRRTTVNTYKNCQAEAVWTGIGYAFAALALSVGLKGIADTEIKSIGDNQMRFGCFWDHWECGHHYTRPMSSWSVLHAVSGLSVDYEKKRLTFRPIDKNITFPLCLPDILAEVTFTDGKCSINCIKGDLSGWKITSL